VKDFYPNYDLESQKMTDNCFVYFCFAEEELFFTYRLKIELKIILIFDCDTSSLFVI